MTIFLCHGNSPSFIGLSAALPAGEVPFDPMGQRQICRSQSSWTLNSFLQLAYCKASFTGKKISLKSSVWLMAFGFSFLPHALLPSPAHHITCCSLVFKYCRRCFSSTAHLITEFNALFLSYRRRYLPKHVYNFYFLHILHSASKWEKNSVARLVIYIQMEWQCVRNFTHFPKTLYNLILWKTHQKCQGTAKQCNGRNITSSLWSHRLNKSSFRKTALNIHKVIKLTENTENWKSTEQHFPHLLDRKSVV